VPLVATATESHVLLASTFSKSVLRVAAEQVASQMQNVFYFPAFEIITGPQAPFEYFESDRRNVSEIGVAEVMNSLLKGLATSKIETANSHTDTKQVNKSKAGRLISEISRRIARAECDEAMMDKNL
jgi:GTP1/Obg family GTP-binding protein